MKGLMLMLLLPIALMLLHSCPSVIAGELHPVVIIPGSGGNQLEVRLTKAYKPSNLVCRLSHWAERDSWFRLWFDPTVLIGPLTHCFADRMMLHFDPDLDDYRNTAGVDTRVPYFGSTQGIRYLDPRLKQITEYMATLVDSLEKIGYRDGHNLFGAPYDFRYGLAPEGHRSRVGNQYLHDLKQLIESAVASNDDKPVILLSHSLGGLFALHLLARNSLAWRHRFVKHLITLSAPWGGTVQEMLTFASGYTLGIPLVDPLIVRDEQRSSESNLWLLPAPSTFGTRPLVITSSINYSASNIPRFLDDIGFESGVHPYNARIVPMIERLPDPGIPVTCIIGTGVDTPETLFYGSEGFNVQPGVVYGDGDGTVNLVSLLRLKSEWSGSTGQALRVVKLPGVSHTGVLKDPAAASEITGEILNINFGSLYSLKIQL